MAVGESTEKTITIYKRIADASEQNKSANNGPGGCEPHLDVMLMRCYPKGFATLGESAMLRRQVRRATGKPRGHRSPRKIDVTGKLTVASVSVVTLIRTDTTLDHSQKAEKV